MLRLFHWQKCPKKDPDTQESEKTDTDPQKREKPHPDPHRRIRVRTKVMRIRNTGNYNQSVLNSITVLAMRA
jgi:hypothetical protein